MTPALLPHTQMAALPGVLYETLAHPSDIEDTIPRRMVLASRFRGSSLRLPLSGMVYCEIATRTLEVGPQLLWHRPHTTVSRPTPSRIVRQPLSKNQIIKRPIRSIYAAALGFVGSCFSLSSLKPNLASSSCTIRAVCALCRMCVSNAPRAIPNISTPSNNRTSGAELTIDTV